MERESPHRLPRICSLVPSATEIVCALDLGAGLVGVSHECDYPPDVRGKAILTRGTIDSEASSAAIDAQVSASLSSGGSLYTLDVALLETLQPDLILTQALCAVCAVSYDDVRQIAANLSSRPRVLSLDPHDIGGILRTMQQVAHACGIPRHGDRVVASLQGRMDALASRVSAAPQRPRVLCLEWLDPPYCAGHWLPEMVTVAGGADPLGRMGGKSARVEWAQITAADPDVVVVMCCGFSVERTLTEMTTLEGHPQWTSLRAVREGQVFVTDGAAYFSRPGPRVAEGIELLASILHPDLCPQRFGIQDVYPYRLPLPR